jgi:hypothetical protein
MSVPSQNSTHGDVIVIVIVIMPTLGSSECTASPTLEQPKHRTDVE